MRTTLLALAATSLIALSAPALAQQADPWARVTGPSRVTGGNSYDDRYQGDRYDRGPGPSAEYPDGPRYRDDGYMNEGRAAAPDYAPGYDNGYDSGGYGRVSPDHGAEVMGPRSNMDGPDDRSDDAR